MIKNIRERNESVKPHDFELKKLRSALPGYFDKDGNFMFDRLQDTLQGNDVNLAKEGYELKFLGKSYAKYLTSTETETVIVPDLKHNAEPENRDSENLYIVGDNLDALKHLLGSYSGKVKCIYIDPPYNTGSDGFVYNDDFGFTPSQLVNKIGISEEEAQRVHDLQGKSSHSAWLTFMYPRLQLAKELLSDDGVIFISIDENEQSNLKILCDEIFGEQNFVSAITVKNNPRGRQSNTSIAPVHDYILVYSKYISKIKINGRRLTDKQRSEYKFEDSYGKYRLLGLRQRGVASLREDRPDMHFPIYVDPKTKSVSLTPKTGWHEVLPFKSDGRAGRWMWGKEKCITDQNRLVAKLIKSRNSYDIFIKDYLNDVNSEERTTKSTTVWTEKQFNQQFGTQEVKKILNGDIASYPKPTPLLEEIIQLGSDSECIIVDFFSGSGTTAESTLRTNAHDKGRRRYIMVQIPEEIDSLKPAYKAGYRTIDEIGRERIKRAAVKIKSETGADIDYGFRLFRLEEPSGQVLDDLEAFNPEQGEAVFSGDYVSKFNNLDQQGTPGRDTILTTWLIQDGYGLTTNACQVELDGYSLDVCGDSAYVIEPGLTSDDVKSLVTMIENGSLNVSRVVIFSYSVEFSVMHELKKNLLVLKSGKSVTTVERF